MLVNLLSGTGLFLSAKLASPWHSGALFLLATGLNSLPAYREGVRDIRNEPELQTSTTLVRKAGFYCLCAGFMVIFAKHRAMAL